MIFFENIKEISKPYRKYVFFFCKINNFHCRYFNPDISGCSINKKIESDQSQTSKQTGSAQLNQHDHIK